MARLLFVTGTAADVRSGSGTFVGISVLKAALERAGHRIDVLAPEPGRGTLSAAGRLLFNVAVRRRAAKLARGADAVVGFDMDGAFLRRGEALHVAALKGVLAEESRFERGVAAIRLGAEAALERLHVRRADRVVATSAHSARRIVADYGIPPDRIRVVPEPIDLARWSAALGPARGVERAVPSVLCVAHLYPRKNVDALLEAFARIRSRAMLRIAGTGPEAEALGRRAARPDLAGRVELLGHVSFDALVAEYRRAEVFCLPSRQEGFGIVFLEAMAAGLPIVAARAAAVPELVVDGECGVLVPPDDVAALAAALESLLSDAELRSRLGVGGRRRVRDYDAPLIASRFLQALDLGARTV
ncbi:MAG: glycosyltransferase family 4 protein [Acidobacteriota bacterium]|nr:glycosyltransferase family 4 protein [Acidobacteriota bacterium]